MKPLRFCSLNSGRQHPEGRGAAAREALAGSENVWLRWPRPTPQAPHPGGCERRTARLRVRHRFEHRGQLGSWCRWSLPQADPALESAPDQAEAGVLLSSYDHINLPSGAALELCQQWGVWFIAASLPVVVVLAEGFCVAVAQLATGSRLRAANVATGRRSRSSCRRSRPEAMERNRAAEARERATRSYRVQARALRAGALVWLEPSVLHRRFLALIAAELAALAEELS